MKECLMLVLTKELERALEEFTELINKYPKSKYAKKSKETCKQFE